MTEQHQPLSREEHLCRICTGVLAFLDKQIAEMESLTEPWERNEMAKMKGEYTDVAFALDLAIQSSRGAREPQIEIETGLREQPV